MSKIEFNPNPVRRERIAALAGVAMVGAGFIGIGSVIGGIDDNWDLGVQKVSVALDDPAYAAKRAYFQSRINKLHEQQAVNLASGIGLIIAGYSISATSHRWRSVHP
jgi:hypothetical protein